MAPEAGCDNGLLDTVCACSYLQGRQSGRKDSSSPCPVSSPRQPCFDPDSLQYNESMTPLGISQLLPCCIAPLLTMSRWQHGGCSCPPLLVRPLGTKELLFQAIFALQHSSTPLCYGHCSAVYPCPVLSLYVIRTHWWCLPDEIQQGCR